MDSILQVRNLKISFRTSNGLVKAVRDISFNLEKGKTLAIVGESGSGKSVTSKAVLGIQAGNSITENGEILFDGMDLLKISEEDMCEIRGDRISMIFQDPLSSLNPIVKIGRQITEAMLLKNKVARKTARRDFNEKLALLKDAMTNAQPDSAVKSEIAEKTAHFDKFNSEAIKMENSFNESYSCAEELIGDIDEFAFMVEKKQKLDYIALLDDMSSKLKRVKNDFLTRNCNDKLEALVEGLKKARHAAASGGKIKSGDAPERLGNAVETAKSVKAFLEELVSREKPNFFRIGYYKLYNPEAEISKTDIPELNENALECLNATFMNRFLELEAKGLEYSANESRRKRAAMLPALKDAADFYAKEESGKTAAMKAAKKLTAQVEDSIDKLEINKSSAAYTFKTSLLAAVEDYYFYQKHNPREERRFARQTAKRERLISRGKTVDWKVIPKDVRNQKELSDRIVSVINRLALEIEAEQGSVSGTDMERKAVELIDWFKEKASQVVYRVTPGMARDKAIKLMEEVGIPEPLLRYNQYPFEFSGGMRQRIVIAIALAANPEILICDEPTTALDVTIQAQILELINKLKKERNLSVIFITHDLGVVANMADDIAVMYAGKIVEYGTADDIFYDPRHPYTWALLSSMPDLDTKEKLDAIPGTPPNMIYPPQGDAFADRNKYAMQIDFEQQPPEFRISDTHWAATWLLHPDAPKVEMPAIIRDRIERMIAKGAKTDE